MAHLPVPFIAHQALPDPLPKHWDMIVSLYRERTKQYLRNRRESFCRTIKNEQERKVRVIAELRSGKFDNLSDRSKKESLQLAQQLETKDDDWVQTVGYPNLAAIDFVLREQISKAFNF